LQVLFRLPQLRKLDKIIVSAEDKIKAENLYGLVLEDRKTIYSHFLPEEPFIDRRISTKEDLPEELVQGDIDTLNLFDEYDRRGNISKDTSRSVSQRYLFGGVDEAKMLNI